MTIMRKATKTETGKTIIWLPATKIVDIKEWNGMEFLRKNCIVLQMDSENVKLGFWAMEDLIDEKRILTATDREAEIISRKLE